MGERREKIWRVKREERETDFNVRIISGDPLYFPLFSNFFLLRKNKTGVDRVDNNLLFLRNHMI